MLVHQNILLKKLQSAGIVSNTVTGQSFNEKGVLTPDEFVKAGDLLVTRCPTWSWSTAPANIRVPYLPENKQYLVTRNIPCFERVSSIPINNHQLPTSDHPKSSHPIEEYLWCSLCGKEFELVDDPLEQEFTYFTHYTAEHLISTHTWNRDRWRFLFICWR